MGSLSGLDHWKLDIIYQTLLVGIEVLEQKAFGFVVR